MRRFLFAFVAVPGLLSCSDSIWPGPDFFTPVEVRITAPSIVEVGDTVRLLIIGHNPTSQTIAMPTPGCGHSLVAEIAGLDREIIARSWGGPSPCPIYDDNVMMAGETDTVAWHWVAPASGRYSAAGGLPVDDRFQKLSDIVTITVR